MYSELFSLISEAWRESAPWTVTLYFISYFSFQTVLTLTMSDRNLHSSPKLHFGFQATQIQHVKMYYRMNEAFHTRMCVIKLHWKLFQYIQKVFYGRISVSS